MNADQFMRIVDKIQSRYDGDHDLPPEGTPLVTWTDDALLDLILTLCERVDKLETQYKQLNSIVEGIYFREGFR